MESRVRILGVRYGAGQVTVMFAAEIVDDAGEVYRAQGVEEASVPEADMGAENWGNADVEAMLRRHKVVDIAQFTGQAEAPLKNRFAEGVTFTW